MSVTAILGFIGILLIIGFIADYLFGKISLPDILVLIVLGYLIGPVFHIIDPSQIGDASQVLSSLALVVILFNGGLSLEYKHVISSAPRALILVFLGILFSMALTGAFVHYILGWTLSGGLLLGAIVAGTSPAIVMPLIARAKVPKKVSSVLNLESAFNGALVIVIALVILQIITTGETDGGLASIAQTVALRFAWGIGFGVIAGIFWLWVLTLIEGEVYDDVLTLAMVFVFYFGVEAVGGSGAIFALTFGIILGNGIDICKFLRIKRAVEVHDLMKKFHSQISFLIKTFFFVYLGLMVTFSEPRLIALGVVISLLLLLARLAAVFLTAIRDDTLMDDKGILTAMYPRGLSAAVVAEIVISSGIPNASSYSHLIIVIIFTTVIISAIGIPIFSGKRKQSETVIGSTRSR